MHHASDSGSIRLLIRDSIRTHLMKQLQPSSMRVLRFGTISGAPPTGHINFELCDHQSKLTSSDLSCVSTLCLSFAPCDNNGSHWRANDACKRMLCGKHEFQRNIEISRSASQEEESTLDDGVLLGGQGPSFKRNTI